MRNKSTVVSARISQVTLEKLKYHASLLRLSPGEFMRFLAWQYLQDPSRFNLP
jgi:hypothetical protein